MSDRPPGRQVVSGRLPPPGHLLPPELETLPSIADRGQTDRVIP